MELTPFVDRLRRDLAAAAESGGDELRQAAERLAYALDPAARLTLMEAISQAASEITAEMPAGGVDVRLDGRELAFVVELPTVGPPVPPPPPAPPAPPAPEDDERGPARFTLRLSESLKTRAEESAAAAGQSLNTWLVGVVRDAVAPPGEAAVRVDVDLSSIPFGGADRRADRGSPFGRGRRMTGWV